MRSAFLEAAAQRLGVGIDELFVRDGTIHRRASNESITYWELSGAVDLARDADGRAAPKRADQLSLVGKSLPRIDLPGKVIGLPVTATRPATQQLSSRLTSVRRSRS